VQKAIGTAFTYIGINHKRTYLQDVKLRRAISKIIPRSDILKYKLKETATLATGLFAPSFYFHQDIINDDYDEQEVKKLLGEAGYKFVGKNWLKNGVPLKLELKISNSGNNVEIAEILKFYFLKLGIDLRVNSMEWGTYMNAYKQGNYDLILANWLGFTGQEMITSIFSSKKMPPFGLNRVFYRNDELDNILDEATSCIDKKRREELYKKGEVMAFLDYAYIPLWHPNVIYTMRKCIKNLRPLPNDSFLALLNLKNEC
jgi:peptide/nickel transport system substrate-binding protein